MTPRVGARLAPLALLMVSSVWADIDRSGNVIDLGREGSLTLGVVISVGLYFGGIVWFITRFKNESTGFFWLMGAVFALIVFSGIANCSG